MNRKKIRLQAPNAKLHGAQGITVYIDGEKQDYITNIKVSDNSMPDSLELDNKNGIEFYADCEIKNDVEFPKAKHLILSNIEEVNNGKSKQ